MESQQPQQTEESEEPKLIYVHQVLKERFHKGYATIYKCSQEINLSSTESKQTFLHLEQAILIIDMGETRRSFFGRVNEELKFPGMFI